MTGVSGRLAFARRISVADIRSLLNELDRVWDSRRLKSFIVVGLVGPMRSEARLRRLPGVDTLGLGVSLPLQLRRSIVGCCGVRLGVMGRLLDCITGCSLLIGEVGDVGDVGELELLDGERLDGGLLGIMISGSVLMLCFFFEL